MASLWSAKARSASAYLLPQSSASTASSSQPAPLTAHQPGSPASTSAGSIAPTTSGSSPMLAPPPSSSGGAPVLTSPGVVGANGNNLTAVIAPFLSQHRGSASSGGPGSPGGPSAPSAAAPRSPSFSQQHLFESPGDGVGDQTWDAIESRVLPLFVGDGLNSTIEELNVLLSRYLSQQLYGTILEELKDLLRDGVQRMMGKFLTNVEFDAPAAATGAVPASQSLYLLRWTEIWVFYFSVVLPYLQSVFLPLQAEIKASRLVNSVRTFVLLSFRDRAVVPHLEDLQLLVQCLDAEFASVGYPSSPPIPAVPLPTSPNPARTHPRTAALPVPDPLGTSARSTAAAESKAAILLQMFLVLGDLPQSQVAGAAATGAGTGDDARVRATLLAVRGELKETVARLRAAREGAGATAAAAAATGAAAHAG
ncbi:hypothetical protein H9P43_003823 [Blastocladiella emersonii ATCC 22665]|nr:hypothetical protein H9P43_003823 [Blastocladiella emersonii ATCC 22665]